MKRHKNHNGKGGSKQSIAQKAKNKIEKRRAKGKGQRPEDRIPVHKRKKTRYGQPMNGVYA